VTLFLYFKLCGPHFAGVGKLDLVISFGTIFCLLYLGYTYLFPHNGSGTSDSDHCPLDNLSRNWYFLLRVAIMVKNHAGKGELDGLDAME
jgi:hypothetical protein